MASWIVFLFVWATYRGLRERSIGTRFRVVGAVSTLIYWFHRSGSARIKKNISLIRPDLNEREIDQGGRRVVATMARSWAAMLGHEFTTLDEVIEKLEARGEIDTLLDYHRSGKKVVATAAHVGPVDEMIGIIPLYDLHVYIPAEPVKPAWLFRLMMRLRLNYGDIIFEPVAKGETLLRAAHYLSEGRIVLLLVDLAAREKSGVLCKIGEGQARFPVGAVKLALEQDATIFPIFPSWGQDWKVQIVIGSPFELIKTEDMNQDIELNTRRLLEEVYGPHIQGNWDSWLRLSWINLEPAPRP